MLSSQMLELGEVNGNLSIKSVYVWMEIIEERPVKITLPALPRQKSRVTVAINEIN